MSGPSRLRRAAPADHTLPLVLLPGTACDVTLFDDLIGRLDGRSIIPAALDGGTDPAGIAAHLLARLPERFALLGFSLGGVVALEIAAHAPDRVAGLALLGSNARAVPPDAHADRRLTARPGPDEAVRTVIDRLWPSYVAPSRCGDAVLRARILAMADATDAATLARQTEIALNRRCSLDRLAALAMPVLVLAGKEDRLNPPEVQREMAARLPNATLALIPDAGHFALLEAPAAVAAHVSAWLDRTDRFAGNQAMLLPPRLREAS